MTCDKCKKEVWRIIGTAEGIGCDDCISVPRLLSHDAMLNRVRTTRFGKLTEADAQRIKTNKKRADGRYRPDPRWRETGD